MGPQKKKKNPGNSGVLSLEWLSVKTKVEDERNEKNLIVDKKKLI